MNRVSMGTCMNKMHVFLSWFKDGGVNPNADAYVVVDVLRFSTTVITALGIGFKRVYATPSLDKALALSRLGIFHWPPRLRVLSPPHG